MATNTYRVNPPKEFSGENFEIFFVKRKAFMIMLDKNFALVYRALEDLHAAPEPNAGTKSVIGKELLITGGDLDAERQSELLSSTLLSFDSAIPGRSFRRT